MMGSSKRQSSLQSRYLLEKTTNFIPSDCTCNLLETKTRHLGHSWFFGGHRGALQPGEHKPKPLCKRCAAQVAITMARPRSTLDPSPPAVEMVVATATSTGTTIYSRSFLSDGKNQVYKVVISSY
jgi:hypothetical protein